MKRIVIWIGVVVFWLTWPLTYIYVRGTTRTRVLLVANGTVLLARIWHGTGSWKLPGGGVHGKESLEAAAVREVFEEVRVTIQPEQLRDLGQKAHKEHGIPYTGQYYYVELADICAVEARMPEILEAAWVPIEVAHERRLGEDSYYALSAYKALVQ